MSFFDRFKKDDDSDPFAGSDGLDASPGPLPGDDPLAPSQQSVGPGASFPPPPGGPLPGGPPPPSMDFTNPDINAQTGTPRPQEHEYSPPSPGLPPPSAPAASSEKDFQLVLAKLDAIKAELDSLHQRIRNIERIAEADEAAAQKTKPSYGRW